jgi:hypothetical protein
MAHVRLEELKTAGRYPIFLSAGELGVFLIEIG